MSKKSYVTCSVCNKQDRPNLLPTRGRRNPGTSIFMSCPDCKTPKTGPYASMCRDCCPTGHGTHFVGEGQEHNLLKGA